MFFLILSVYHITLLESRFTDQSEVGKELAPQRKENAEAFY